jgi:oxygen-dependent protoporphyrinogen oxidase
MQSLAEALLARTPVEQHLGTRARALARVDKGWRIELERGAALQADAVVLATEPHAAAELVSASVPELARELEAIACPPVAVVGLGYGPQALERVPHGFGALIGREQGLRSLGCLFEGRMFAGRGPADGLLVRVLLGGALDPGIGTLSEAEILRIAREEMARLLGLDEQPRSEQVWLWPRAIPQYELGHAERCERIEQIVERSFGLELAGTACGGVSFPRAAASGWQAGERALRWLAGR